jgi:hypothetical protein
VLDHHAPPTPVADDCRAARTDASRVVCRVRNYNLLVPGVSARCDAVEGNAVVGYLRLVASGGSRQRHTDVGEREDKAFEIPLIFWKIPYGMTGGRYQ